MCDVDPMRGYPGTWGGRERGYEFTRADIFGRWLFADCLSKDNVE